MIAPRPIKSPESEYFRTGIRIRKDVWDSLSVACQVMGLKKGQCLEDLIKEWLNKNQAKIQWHLKDKVPTMLETTND